ncbi:hypothetical protein ACFQRK_16395 [Parapedobacter sp. GCM10030251]|uniref:hypothetical protein n=1 Tax=Parapedobacter sp. GCM10030251 TaxID=3273419 RepID=UPI0036169982
MEFRNNSHPTSKTEALYIRHDIKSYNIIRTRPCGIIHPDPTGLNLPFVWHLQVTWQPIRNLTVQELATPIQELSLFKIAWYLFDHQPFKIFIGISQIVASLLLLFNRTMVIGALMLVPIVANILIIDLTIMPYAFKLAFFFGSWHTSARSDCYCGITDSTSGQHGDKSPQYAPYAFPRKKRLPTYWCWCLSLHWKSFPGCLKWLILPLCIRHRSLRGSARFSADDPGGGYRRFIIHARHDHRLISRLRHRTDSGSFGDW